jgi:predicted dienelactone hydrolase
MRLLKPSLQVAPQELSLEGWVSILRMGAISPGGRVGWATLLAGTFLLIVAEAHQAATPRSYPKPTYPPPRRYAVRTAKDLVLHDNGRNKDLPFNVLYPDGRGPFPVIIFSHGAGASRDNYVSLTSGWASHGYIVIQPSHADSIALRRSQGKPGGWGEALHEALADPNAWQNRPQDISFLIDSLTQIQRMVPELKQTMDINSIGVGGHSFGAYTSEAIAGALVQLKKDSPPVSFADRRVTAVVAMSPQGPGQIGFVDNSWNDQHLPIMTMTGTWDYAGFDKGPSWRKIPFDRSPGGDKYHLLITGANHFSFVGPGGDEGEKGTIFSYIQASSLAFWDAYLKHDAKALAYLQSDSLSGSSDGLVTLYHK